jgi:site-specific recombinase XerD
MLKDIVPANADVPPLGLCDAHVDAFVKSLSGSGYAALTVRTKRQIVVSFARWTRQRQIAVADLDESHVATFLDQARRRSKSRDAVKRSALRLLLKYLCAEGEVSTPPPPSDQSPVAVLQERYESHLRRERGLADKSVRTYRHFIREFLVERVGTTDSTCAAALNPQDVRDFLLDRIRKRPTKSSKLLATALRSFLRFLFLRGETAVDLSLAVPTVRQWRQATVHSFLRPEEVEHALRACDGTTLVGRRDHAVLLLLARLGLRAGEVVALELGDIRWKTGEILVRGKGQVLEHLPLLADIGEALAVYLHDDRGQSASRRVFLRMRAPRVGLTSQTAVGAIARRAIARAGLRPSLRGAHLFRYSLATNMIRRGASLAEISEVLRHRSPDTTEIYAKVDFEALRGVARPWPGTGGGR